MPEKERDITVEEKYAEFGPECVVCGKKGTQEYNPYYEGYTHLACWNPLEKGIEEYFEKLIHTREVVHDMRNCELAERCREIKSCCCYGKVSYDGAGRATIQNIRCVHSKRYYKDRGRIY